MLLRLIPEWPDKDPVIIVDRICVEVVTTQTQIGKGSCSCGVCA